MNTGETHRPGLKTWSALMGSKKRPSEYEVVSYQLHYRTRHPAAPYEQSPDTQMNQWYKKYVGNSPLQHSNWDGFRDPEELTYRSYCAMQDGQEQYVDGLLNAHDENASDKSLAADWVNTVALLYTPARYLMAAAQMASSYVVQMAPASTITNCAVFQEADSFRWLSRIAYRTRELANSHPEAGFAKNERRHWEEAPEWQGFRELFEKTLATFDWGENIVALNVVGLRAVDFGFVQALKVAAHARGDSLTAMLCDNHARDGARSRRWTSAFVRHALGNQENDGVIAGWIEKWSPLADKAIDGYCAGLPNNAELASNAKKALRAYWSDLGLNDVDKAERGIA